jgi:hypothetical protein
MEGRIPLPQQWVYSDIRKSIEKLEIAKGNHLDPNNYIEIDAKKVTAYLQAAKRAKIRVKTHKVGGRKAIVWRVA